MVQFTTILPAILFASLAFGAPSTHLRTRQIGGLQCNLNRLSIVRALGNAQDSVDAMAAAATDAATTALVADAQAGLDGAQGGIQNIAQSIVAAENAGAEDRDAVADGLTAAITAVEGIQDGSDGSNEDLDSAAAEAAQSLADAAEAGQAVVDTCA